MRVATAVLLVLLAALHENACAGNIREDPRTRLGRALLRRAKLAGIIGTNDDVTTEDNDTSGEDQEQMMKEDAAEDIFVGSQSDQHSADSSAPQVTKEGSGNGETEGTEDEQTAHANEGAEPERPEGADEETSGEEPGADNRTDASSGDGGQGDDDAEDDDDGSGSGAADDDDNGDASGAEDGSADKTEPDDTDNDARTTAEQPLTSESGNSEGTEARSEVQTSGSGTGSETTGNGEEDSSGNEEQESPEEANTTQGDDASGSENENATSAEIGGPTTEASGDLPAARRSDIEISSGESDEDDEASAAIIKKGVESLSRLLSPVASGLDFTLYSGSAVVSETGDKDSEGDGEDESGQGTDDLSEVKVKQCKQVCGPPMSYHECAIPRCNLKMGTIKDLCFWLCEHQTDVCRQECE